MAEVSRPDSDIRTINAEAEPGTDLTDNGVENSGSSTSGKICSIVLFGADDPARLNSYLKHLPVEDLPSDYELLIVNGSVQEFVKVQSKAIKVSVTILEVVQAFGIEQLCVEAAKQAQGHYVIFANNPVSYPQIVSAMRQLEESETYVITNPEKFYIIVQRQEFLEYGGFDPGKRPRTWNTELTQAAGLGSVLEISNRVAMLGLLPKNSVVAEIGVFKGRFSEEILNVTSPLQLHLIDAWPEKFIRSDGEDLSGYEAYLFVKDKFADEIRNGKVVLCREFSAEAASQFEDGYFDWIYIDAGHYYEEVKDDLNRWFPKVKVGGFITGHDYIEKEWYGIVKAVNEFVQKRSVVFVGLTQDTKESPSWILKKVGR